jgi:hypothetical protein
MLEGLCLVVSFGIFILECMAKCVRFICNHKKVNTKEEEEEEPRKRGPMDTTMFEADLSSYPTG